MFHLPCEKHVLFFNSKDKLETIFFIKNAFTNQVLVNFSHLVLRSCIPSISFLYILCAIIHHLNAAKQSSFKNKQTNYVLSLIYTKIFEIPSILM
jgi:hypothetical protein